MSYKVKDTNVKLATRGEHHHYWIIESANGPTSTGVCKYCGAEKEFFNVVPTPEDLKKNAQLFDLPKLPDIDIDKGNKS